MDLSTKATEGELACTRRSVSNYAGLPIGPSLPGAKLDYHRIAEALSQAGFVVTSLIDPDRESLAKALKNFEARTAYSDVALIYTTGHGVETDGVSRVLLPYARADRSNALPVTELAKAARARRANLIFYAACRSKPIFRSAQRVIGADQLLAEADKLPFVGPALSALPNSARASRQL